ncbi:putative FeS-containing Cyanobacterial-specific oxidoreductase [Chryseobacterium sp. StRB126]|uniref:hypothetical protein n=1 Tax=Chryseobacterium sp. StRB126 TaxID=878220 RepID=UPI0004E99715|nr:hypothetical protein [Chryseobacterium sp. StRB126]BAP32642.1 putative FeS-containing Cyanobacterial-specific oxidoreductase [Chryseobacterium sp. StRB126]
MKTYQFHFNNNKKTAAILLWFFSTLLTITLTTTILVVPVEDYFPNWLLLFTFPLMLLSIYKLYKVASRRQSIEIITVNKEGFTSSCFGAVLFSEITSIKIPAREISLLGGVNYDYYKRTEADIPHLVTSITANDGKTLCWVLDEWGGLYNSKEDFSVFFDFLTALTDQMYPLYHDNETASTYLKILDETGSWEKSREQNLIG